VPLRPLSLGEILDGAFRAIRSNPKTMIGVSAIVLAITSVVSIIPQAGLEQLLGRGLADAQASGDPMAIIPQSLSVSLATVPGALLVGLATIVLNAMLVVAVSAAVLGQKISPSQLWRRVKRRVPAAIGLSLLSGLLITVADAALLAPGVVALVTGHTTTGIILILLGAIAVLVVSVTLSVRWSLAAPALLLEDQSVVASMRRSWRLVGGSFWRVLLIEGLAYVLMYVGSAVIAGPISLVGAGVQFATDNTTYSHFWSNLAMAAINSVGQIVVGAIFNPWISAVIALIYVDLRMRREGLDIELLRAADAGVAG
jgi:hypothetical protein